MSAILKQVVTQLVRGDTADRPRDETVAKVTRELLDRLALALR